MDDAARGSGVLHIYRPEVRVVYVRSLVTLGITNDSLVQERRRVRRRAVGAAVDSNRTVEEAGDLLESIALFDHPSRGVIAILHYGRTAIRVSQRGHSVVLIPVNGERSCDGIALNIFHLREVTVWVVGELHGSRKRIGNSRNATETVIIDYQRAASCIRHSKQAGRVNEIRLIAVPINHTRYP